jgi:hypothetical protein
MAIDVPDFDPFFFQVATLGDVTLPVACNGDRDTVRHTQNGLILGQITRGKDTVALQTSHGRSGNPDGT